MLVITNVTFAYRKHKVLNGVSLKARKGECIGILGTNGSGKSTLLSVIAGARKPSGGSICYNDQELLKKHRLHGELIGYVPQEPPLFPELSVKDNLRLWYAGNMDFKTWINEGIVSSLELSHVLNSPVRTLSGGMKKRVSIGCALVTMPSVLILDEPGAALDLVCREVIENFIESYLKNGGIVLIATHEETEMNLCNRLLVFQQGKLKEIDSAIRGKELSCLLRGQPFDMQKGEKS
jgi:ABC-type multidrug transport system ATPase subunit